MSAFEEDRMARPPRPQRPPRPPFDTVAFVLGSLFMLVAVYGLLGTPLVRRLDLGIALPVALVAIGLAVLTGSLGPARRRRSRTAEDRTSEDRPPVS